MLHYNFNDVEFILANNNRHRLLNNIQIANVIDGDKVAKGNNKYYYLKKIGQLDFYQEISGFFHARTKVYVEAGMEQFAIDNVPSDVELKSGLSICAGDYVIDSEFNVYRITGWDNQSNSEIYFDFVDGDGSHQLYLNKNGKYTNIA